jgi:hypothetical protein
MTMLLLTAAVIIIIVVVFVLNFFPFSVFLPIILFYKFLGLRSGGC